MPDVSLGETGGEAGLGILGSAVCGELNEMFAGGLGINIQRTLAGTA